ncbi:hypothetical protein QMG90_05245 [Trabulsiella odontotermitis]|nr:hypothetical protein [Trabulsiella odontotermitis]WHP32338.1 hypothetical protein QMG90_05245 [Trabulsiella odontotermitis]
MGVFPSYPIFLWITGCKILFIVSDQFRKTSFAVSDCVPENIKKPI